MTSIASWLTYTSESFHEKVLLALSPSTALYRWYTTPSEDEPAKPEAPAIVSMTPGVSFVNQIRAFLWGGDMVQKGYDQHKGEMFRMPFMGQWVTVVSGKYITEMVRAPDSVLSFQEAVNESIQLELQMGPEIAHDHVHLPVIRALTRNLDAVYPEILDETRYILAEKLKDADKDGWITITAFEVFDEIIGQLNHRAFIGLPLCRDDKWAKIMRRCQTDLVLRGTVLKAFPKTKRENAKEYLSGYGKVWDEAVGLLTPVIEERREMAGEMPNDLLTWVMTRVPGEEPTPRAIINLFQLIDMVAHTTTSATFVHALLYVATYTEDVEQLREEILEATIAEGFTRDAINKMPKLDSFVGETQRLSGISSVSLVRVALQDFTFSNGVIIPQGNMVQAVGNPVHHDGEIYPDPMEFKPWRFYELAKHEEKGSKKYDVVTTSEEYLAWGRGKHACPGRWYATLVVKHLLAYLITHYEIKLEDSAKGKRPADWRLAGGVFPSTKAKLLFKKREDLGWNESVFLR